MSDVDTCGCDEGWDHTCAGPIVSFDSRRRNNAELIRDLVDLGYLHDGMNVLDLTYGKGRFWKLYRPPLLVTNDLDVATFADFHEDFLVPRDEWRDLFDFVVLDPPYGLRGTVNDTNGDYGLGVYMPVDARHTMMHGALSVASTLCASDGYLLYKCQEQTCNGQKYPQPYMAYGWAMERDLEYVASFQVHSHRGQPAGRRQANIHQNYSTALLFQRSS